MLVTKETPDAVIAVNHQLLSVKRHFREPMTIVPSAHFSPELDLWGITRPCGVTVEAEWWQLRLV